PEGGIWWPPFTALGLAPFALVARWSLALAKACWAVLNVGCLGCSLALARRWTTGWLPLVLAVAAVGKPLQSNFEHLNLLPRLAPGRRRGTRARVRRRGAGGLAAERP